MSGRSIFAIVFVLVAALLLVGAGMAYTSYTSNGGNSAISTYLVVTPSKDLQVPIYSESFDVTLAFDSQVFVADNAIKVRYSLADSTLAPPFGDGVEYVFLGTIYLTVDQTRSSDSYDLVMVESGSVSGMDFATYDYKVQLRMLNGETVPTKSAVDAVTPDPLASFTSDGGFIKADVPNSSAAAYNYNVFRLDLYASLHGGNTMVLPKDSEPNNVVLDDVVFVFNVEADMDD